MGQQWPAVGTGALAAADLEHVAHGISPLGGNCHWPHHRAAGQVTHKLENCYTKEILTLLRKCYDPQRISQPGHPARGLRTPREFDFGGQWNLITELPKDWGNRFLEGTDKALCAPGPRRKEQ